MAKVVSEPQARRVTCDACRAVLEYLPEEIERYSGADYSGGPDGWERVKCPRTGCTGHGYIRRW